MRFSAYSNRAARRGPDHSPMRGKTPCIKPAVRWLCSQLIILEEGVADR
jgi:hypothetical protein